MTPSPHRRTHATPRPSMIQRLSVSQRLGQPGSGQTAPHRHEEGATLLVTVMTVTVLVAALLAVSTQMTLNTRSAAADRRDTLQAQYAAESGLAVSSTYLNDIQSIFVGVTKPDGTLTPVLSVPKTLTASALLVLAEQYCGAPSWQQTSAAGTYPVKSRCDANASTASNRYDVLAQFVQLGNLPASLKTSLGITTQGALQNFWRSAFSAQGLSVTPSGASYSVSYRLRPTKVLRENSSNFKFFMQVDSVRATGFKGSATRVIDAKPTASSEIWFQIALPVFSDKVLFTNHHTTKNNARPNFTDQSFDGPVHTNDRFTFASGATAQFKSKVTSAGCYSFATDGTCATNSDATYKQQPGLYVGSTLNTLGNGLGGLVGSVVNSLTALTAKVPSGTTFPTAAGKGPKWDAEFQPMPTNAEDQKKEAELAGLVIPDGATVTLAASTSASSVVSPTTYSTTEKKWTPAPTYQFITVQKGSSTTTYRLNPAGKLEIKDGTIWKTERANFNGVLYSPGASTTSSAGTITITGPERSGTTPPPAIAGFAQLTIAANDDIGISGDLTYSDVPCKGTETCTSKPTPANLLGVYAQRGDISVLTSAPDDLNIHGVVMSGEGEVNVQNHNKTVTRTEQQLQSVCVERDRRGRCTKYEDQLKDVQVTVGGRGEINLIGGLIENYYGAFGTFDPRTPLVTKTGYGRNFSFDERMGEGYGMSPPFFPLSPKWKVESPTDEGLALTNLAWQQGRK